MLEYKMAFPKTDGGTEVELNKMAAQGWRLTIAYSRGAHNVLIFERERQ